MSLRIYSKEEFDYSDSSVEVVDDVEVGFLMFSLEDSTLNKKAINQIEKGTYLDTESFIDRFGYKLYKTFLSTGCKAALCVINMSDKVINTIECGDNAIDFIIKNCTSGAIILYRESVMLSDSISPIDVILDDKKFTSISDLNSYIENERAFKIK